MELLTDDRQFLLGLGMMAADPKSGLYVTERKEILALLSENAGFMFEQMKPAFHEKLKPWVPRIEKYLAQRQAEREESTR